MEDFKRLKGEAEGAKKEEGGDVVVAVGRKKYTGSEEITKQLLSLEKAFESATGKLAQAQSRRKQMTMDL